MIKRLPYISYKLLVLFFAVVFMTGNTYGQNDACGITAPALTPGVTCVTTNYTIDAAFTADAPAATTCVTAGNNREDGWFRFVATNTTSTVTVTCNRDAAIAVYSVACPAVGAQVACVDAGGGGTTETTTFTTIIGVTYYVRIIRYNSGGANNMTGTICVTVPAPPPANDNCLTSTLLTVDNSCVTSAATNVSATASGGTNPSCASYGGGDVWFRFVAANVSTTISTTAGTLTDGGMSLYSGTCLTLSEIECDDDDGPGSMPMIQRCDLTVGATYYVRVWGYDGAQGTFNICVFNTSGSTASTTNNCVGGTTVCNDASFSGNSTGSGAQELSALNRGCLTNNEHQSSWYFFQAQTSGTIQLNITPANGTDDYDFAIWGPFTGSLGCPPCDAPFRCSYAGGGGTTGLSTGSVDVSEGAGGDRFVSAINATAGQRFIMVIDNFSVSSQPFTLDWTLTGGATLGCTVLPVELLSFSGTAEGIRNKLNWMTASETNNQYFTLERSANGYDFYELTKVQGAGTSSSMHFYESYDENPLEGINYYRLKQVDFDGHSVYSEVVALKNNYAPIGMEVFPVPASEVIQVQFSESLSAGSSIEIVDVTGRRVMAHVNDDDLYALSLDISTLVKGIYFISAQNSRLHKKSALKKIIVE